MFTLFNLQGTLRNFPDFGSCFIVLSNSARIFFILSRSTSFVKNFFKFFFEVFCEEALLRSSLHIITVQNPFVNTFFRFFSNFFAVSTSCIFFHNSPQYLVAFPPHNVQTALLFVVRCRNCCNRFAVAV